MWNRAMTQLAGLLGKVLVWEKRRRQSGPSLRLKLVSMRGRVGSLDLDILLLLSGGRRQRRLVLKPKQSLQFMANNLPTGCVGVSVPELLRRCVGPLRRQRRRLRGS